LTNIVLLPGMDGTGLLFNNLMEKLPDYLKPIVCAYPDSAKLQYKDLNAFALAACSKAGGYIVLGESF